MAWLHLHSQSSSLLKEELSVVSFVFQAEMSPSFTEFSLLAFLGWNPSQSWLGRNKERGLPLGPNTLKKFSADLCLQAISVPHGTGISRSSSPCQELDPKALRSYTDDTGVEQEQSELGFLDPAPSTAPQSTRLPRGR